MRFYYIALAVAATILAAANSVAADAELAQISSTGPIENAVKRSLRVHETYDATEERVKGGSIVTQLLNKKKLNVDLEKVVGQGVINKLLNKLTKRKFNQKQLMDFLGKKNAVLYDKVKGDFPVVVKKVKVEHHW